MAVWYGEAAVFLARPADEGVPAAVRRGSGTQRRGTDGRQSTRLFRRQTTIASVCVMAVWYGEAAVFLARPADEGVPAAVRRGSGTQRRGTDGRQSTRLFRRQTTIASVCVMAVWYGEAAVFLARPADEGVPAAVRRGSGTQRRGTDGRQSTRLFRRQTTIASVCVMAVWYGEAAVFLARPADEGVPAAVRRGSGTQRRDADGRQSTRLFRRQTTIASVCVMAVWYGEAAVFLGRPADEGVPAAVRRGSGTQRRDADGRQSTRLFRRQTTSLGGRDGG